MNTTTIVFTIIFLVVIISVSAVIIYWVIYQRRQKQPQIVEEPITSKQKQPQITEEPTVPKQKQPQIAQEPTTPKQKLPPLDYDGDRWRVLVIDDLPKWGEAVAQYSKLLPCDIRLSTSLISAEKILHSWKPHVILLDLHMPRDDWKAKESLRHKYLSGQKTLAFCEQVKTDPATANVLVVMISVEKQKVSQEKALEAGAFHFYNKANFKVEDLEELLQIVQSSSATKDA